MTSLTSDVLTVKYYLYVSINYSCAQTKRVWCLHSPDASAHGLKLLAEVELLVDSDFVFDVESLFGIVLIHYVGIYVRSHISAGILDEP